MQHKPFYGHKIQLVLALVGPTGIGKSEVACELAERIGGEIVSADSMQIYRELDIGTAKPSKRERDRLPHHMIDVVSVREDYSVARFQEDARGAVSDIQKRGKTPLVVGGSGLYVRAVIDELVFPPHTAEGARIRKSLEEEAEKQGAGHMYAMLKDLDPEAAARIHPNNLRRIIRVLEVKNLSGRQFSRFPKAWERRESIYDLRMIGLKADRRLLNEMIEKRVDRMFEAGLVGEVEELIGLGFAEALNNKRALGYVEVLDHLEKGIPREEAREKTKQKTRRFAKRQMTWFNADKRIEWFDRKKEDTATMLADRIESYISM